MSASLFSIQQKSHPATLSESHRQSLLGLLAVQVDKMNHRNFFPPLLLTPFCSGMLTKPEIILASFVS